MDKIEKALSKLNSKEKYRVKEILIQINTNDFQGLDFKKLTGRKDIFRVRKGNIRIIFQKKQDLIKILTIEKRGSKTYRR